LSVLGPLEKPFSGKPEEAKVEAEDVSEMLRVVRQYFPSIESHRVSRAVTGIHCRVVDPRHPAGHAQAMFDHAEDGVEGLYSLVGGGLTRARRLAEQVTNLICKRLRQKERCRTHLESLPGCTSEIPWLEEARRTQRDPLLVARLIRRYGHKAEGILDAATRNMELAHTLCECEQVLAAEVEYVVRKEWVTSLGDLKRRTLLGEGSCKGCRCVRGAGYFLGSLLGWNAEQTEKQIAAHASCFPSELTWSDQLKEKEYAAALEGFSGVERADGN
jgi:glycerol-3-phosphate dehydrogenase